MPYASIKQMRWAHTKTGTEALGGPEKVKEWDAASKNMKLPAKAIKSSAKKLAKLKAVGGAKEAKNQSAEMSKSKRGGKC